MAWRRLGDKPLSKPRDLNQWWLVYRRIYASLGLIVISFWVYAFGGSGVNVVLVVNEDDEDDDADGGGGSGGGDVHHINNILLQQFLKFTSFFHFIIL